MSLQTIVTGSPLTQDEKDFLLQRLELEGATPDVVAAIKAALQEYIDAGFKTLGVALDPNDPKVQAIQQQFEEDLAAAQSEFTEELENASIDAAIVQAQAGRKLDALQAGAVKMQMAS